MRNGEERQGFLGEKNRQKTSQVQKIISIQQLPTHLLLIHPDLVGL